MSFSAHQTNLENNVRRNLRDIPASIERIFDKEVRQQQKERLENLRKEFNALIVKDVSNETYNEMIALDRKSHEFLVQCNNAAILINDAYKREILHTIERLKKIRDAFPTDARCGIWNNSIITLNNTYKLTVYPRTNPVTEEDFETLRRILPEDEVKELAESIPQYDGIHRKDNHLADLYDKFRECAKRAEALPDCYKLVVPGFKKGRHVRTEDIGKTCFFGIAEFQNFPMFTIESHGHVNFAIVEYNDQITSNCPDQIHIFEPLLDIIIKDY